tara:strand:+ start:2353 stop:2574 length:222 start_codon:yes stop_codon:yes gene_type:complete
MYNLLQYALALIPALALLLHLSGEGAGGAQVANKAAAVATQQQVQAHLQAGAVEGLVRKVDMIARLLGDVAAA